MKNINSHLNFFKCYHCEDISIYKEWNKNTVIQYGYPIVTMEEMYEGETLSEFVCPKCKGICSVTKEDIRKGEAIEKIQKS